MVAPSLTDTPSDRRLPPTLNASQRQFGASVSLSIRQSRAELKRWLSGEGPGPEWARNRFADALSETRAQGMKVKSLLLALPGIGPKRAARILAEAGLTADRSVRSLGPKQRERLVALLTRSP